jgi:HEAT repeat protein
VVSLPPEDQPDTIDVGPITGIPVHYENDPRFESDRQAWSLARRRAQAMHSADELLAGLRDEDWRVRSEVVDRLIARARDDVRTLPALLAAAIDDTSWEVRDSVVMALIRFELPQVVETLRLAEMTLTQR